MGILSLLLVQMGTFGINQVVNGQSDSGIPGWIKINAGWWADDQIDDDTFVQGIQFLIKEGVVKIPATEQGEGSDSGIPGWIKINAGWWADDQIDDDTFVQGIQFLIKEGVVKIPATEQIVDSDGDQILDDVDVCPNQPETINQFEDSDGCPDVLPVIDSDGDQILDDVDVCPNQPETINQFEDSDGCPDTQPLTVTSDTALDKSLTISDVQITTQSSGWGDQRLKISWIYSVEHVDLTGVGFPSDGHFVIEITGIETIIDKAEFDEDNKFTGQFNGIDPGIEGGPVTVTVISFIGDDRGNYVGDGDTTEIIIPPHSP